MKKKLPILVCALICALMNVSGLFATDQSQYINIGENKTIVSSSNFSDVFAAHNANDGNYSTVWGSAGAETYEWIYIDLGVRQRTDGFRISWFDQFYAIAYDIYYSNDGTNWDLKFGSMAGNGGIDERFETVSARYIGFMLKKCNSTAYGILELEILQKDPVYNNDDWNLIRPALDINYMNDIEFIDELNGWAVGDYGTVAHTIDGGKTWDYPIKDGIRNFKSIYFLDNTHGWIVGSYGSVLITTDSGQTWIDRSTDSSGSLTDVYFVNENQGWAGDYDGSIFKTNDGGYTWQQVFQDSSKAKSICKIRFLDANKGFVLANYSSQAVVLLTTLDGGQTWNDTVFPSQSGGSLTESWYAIDLQFTDAQHGLFFTGLNRDESPRELYTTNDGGATWYLEAKLTYLSKLYFTDALNGWAINNGESQDGEIMRTNDGGKSWTTTGFITNSQLNILFKKGTSPLYTAGLHGDIYKSSDNGITWSTVVDSTYYETLDSIHFIDTNNGWIIRNPTTLAPDRISKTTDGGQSWQNISLSFTGELNKVYFTDLNHGWVTGNQNSNAYVLKTNNAGVSWTLHTVANTRVNVKDIYFIDSKYGWLIGDKGIYKTSNGGTSWTQTSQFDGKDISFISLYQGWACGTNNNTGVLKKTTNSGNTWTDYTVDSILQSIEAVHFFDTQSGLVIGTDENGNSWLYRTADGGNTWQIEKLCEQYSSFQFVTSGSGWMIGDNDIAYINSYGENWKHRWHFENDIFDRIKSIYFYNSKIGWAAGRDGKIYQMNY